VWAIFVLFLLWVFGGASTRFVPSLAEVAEALPGFVTDPETWADIGITFRRVVGSLFAAAVLGLGAAYLIYQQGFAGQVVSVYVRLALGLPSTIAALLALFIFRRSPIGVYLVVTVITFPFIVLTLLGGMQAADRRLDEMSRVYRFGTRRHLRHVTVPHLVPYTFSAIRNENAHAWRVVVLAEVFAVSNGMGARFSRAFDRFILVDVLLWLFAFMAIMLATEYLILRPLERSALRWRRQSSTQAAEREATR
jgi:NitT/TauT family transport system permease protein